MFLIDVFLLERNYRALLVGYSQRCIFGLCTGNCGDGLQYSSRDELVLRLAILT